MFFKNLWQHCTSHGNFIAIAFTCPVQFHSPVINMKRLIKLARSIYLNKETIKVILFWFTFHGSSFQ